MGLQLTLHVLSGNKVETKLISAFVNHRGGDQTTYK